MTKKIAIPTITTAALLLIAAVAFAALRVNSASLKLVVNSSTNDSTDKVAYSANLTSESASAFNPARDSLSFRLRTVEGEFYRITVPAGGFDQADLTETYHINSYGRSASGLFSGSMSIKKNADGTLDFNLNDPGVSLPDWNYETTDVNIVFGTSVEESDAIHLASLGGTWKGSK